MQTRIAKLIAAVAIIVWALGGIIGVVMGAQYASYPSTFNFWAMLLYWVIFFIIGTLYYGFAMLVDQVICLRDETSHSLSGIFTAVTRLAAVMEGKRMPSAPPTPAPYNNAAAFRPMQPTAPPTQPAPPTPAAYNEAVLPPIQQPTQPAPPAPAAYNEAARRLMQFRKSEMKHPDRDSLICPNCGRMQRSDRMACFHCGAIFIEDPSPQAAEAPVGPGAIFCPYCGNSSPRYGIPATGAAAS